MGKLRLRPQSDCGRAGAAWGWGSPSRGAPSPGAGSLTLTARPGRGPTVQTAQGAGVVPGPRAGAGHSSSPRAPACLRGLTPAPAACVWGLSPSSRCRGGGRGGRTWQLPGEAVGRDPRGCFLGPWPWGRVSRWKAGDRAAVPLLEGLVAPASSSPAMTQAGGRKGSRRPHRLCSRPRRPAPEAPVVTPCHAGTVPWAGVAGCVTSARLLAVAEGAGASGSDRPGPNPASAPSQL